MNSTPHILIYITCGNEENARQIATTLVTERLAACVNILPTVQSVYRWQGKVQTDSEYLLLIKSTFATFPVLQERVRDLHQYELPEIIAVPIVAGSQPYLNWITESVTHHAE